MDGLSNVRRNYIIGFAKWPLNVKYFATCINALLYVAMITCLMNLTRRNPRGYETANHTVDTDGSE
jgi:hypothetical protein